MGNINSLGLFDDHFLLDKKQLEEIQQNFILEDNSTNLDIEYNNLFETANLLIEKLPSQRKKYFF
jgi:hypothetical protein